MNTANKINGPVERHFSWTQGCQATRYSFGCAAWQLAPCRSYSCLGSRVPFCAFALAIFHFFFKSMPYLATVGARSGVLAKWMQWMRLAGLLARLWCTAGACYFDVFESLATRDYLWTLWRNSGTPFEARPDLPDLLGYFKVPGFVCRNKYIKSWSNARHPPGATIKLIIVFRLDSALTYYKNGYRKKNIDSY